MATGIAFLEDLIASIDDPEYIIPKPNYIRTLQTKQGTITTDQEL